MKDRGSARPPTPASRGSQTGTRNHQERLQWIAGAGLLGLAIAAAVSFSRVRVCDQELTGEGKAVAVCRHLQMTDPPVVAFGGFLLLALGAFFTEVSGFGISLKREVRTVRETAELAKARTETLTETTDDLAEGVGRALSQGPPPDLPGAGEESPELGEIARLASDYNHLRWTMPSGSQRTTAMTAVVNRMIAVLKEGSGFDVAGCLVSEDRGLRLAAYAYLYTSPEPQFTVQLVDAVLAEDKPFGQYWGLKALVRLLEVDSHALDREAKSRLERLEPELAHDSDRAVTLRRALSLAAS